MASKVVFGIFITLLAYYIGRSISEKFRNPLVNPLLIGAIVCIIILILTGTSYEEYMVGGSYISFLVSLATVSLAMPFYKNLHIFLKYKKAIIVGSCLGALVSLASILILGKVLGVEDTLLISILPKSVTTAIGAPLSQMYGGDYSITAISISLTGILGSMVFRRCFAILDIKSDVVKGAALGTSAHAMGTTEALGISEVAGAISGICIVIAGIATVIFMPFLIKLI